MNNNKTFYITYWAGKHKKHITRLGKHGEKSRFDVKYIYLQHAMMSTHMIYREEAFDHFDIISRDLISIISKNNIKPIESLNKKLDPNFHQAMMEIENDQKEPGTIVQEIQKGFTMKDRLLRPSLVAVAKKSQKIEEKSDEKIKK